jgi:hypothetical protein
MKLYFNLCLTESDLGNLHCSFPHKVHWYGYNLCAMSQQCFKGVLTSLWMLLDRLLEKTQFD